MAATSTDGMRRWLGKRWGALHKSAYAVGVLGVWHYWWQVKADILEPLIYAIILTALLGHRVWHSLQASQARRISAAPVGQTGS